MVLFTLTLVRHGQTDANISHTIQGQSDVPLNSAGETQAKFLGDAFALVHFTKIITSDLSRTKRTCEIALKRNCLITSDNIAEFYESDKRLRERCYGEYEGLPVRKLQLLARSQGIKKIIEVTTEGGESLHEFQSRVINWFDDLCDKIHAQESRKRQPSGNRTTQNLKSILTPWLEIEEDRKVNGFGHCEEQPAPSTLVTCNTSNGSPVTSAEQQQSSSNSLDSGLPIEEPLSLVISDQSRSRTRKSISSCSSNDMDISPGLGPNSPFLITPSSGYRPFCRKSSTLSSLSDDSNFPEIEANILVFTHGGVIRELLRYFTETLGCLVPGGSQIALSLSPNTGWSKFMVHFSPESGELSVTCQELHNKDHLFKMA